MPDLAEQARSRLAHERAYGSAELVLPEHRLLLASTPIELVEDNLEREAMILQRLNALIAHAGRTPYYRSTLPSGDLETLEQIRQLPITDKTTLQTYNNGLGAPMQIPGMTGIQIYTTTSSTGLPALSYRHHDELGPHFARAARFIDYALPDKELILAINLLKYASMWSGGIAVHNEFSAAGLNFIPMGSQAPKEEIVHYWSKLRPNVAFVMPSWLVDITRYLEERGLLGSISQFQTIMYLGEPFPQAAENYVRGKTLAPDGQIRSFLASTEGGAIAFQACDESVDGNYMHVIPDAAYVEIVGQDDYQPVNAGTTGRLILTSFNRLHAPVIRYDSADLARVVDGNCPCGLQTPLIQLAGRAGDRVKLGTGVDFFDFGVIMKAVTNQAKLQTGTDLPISQVVITQDGPVPTVTVKLEAPDSARDGVSQVVTPGLVKDAMCGYGDLVGVNRDWYDRVMIVKVEVVPTGSLERVGVAEKVRPVADLRIKS